MKRQFQLIIIALLTFAIVKASTFGCAMRNKASFGYLQGNEELAEALKAHVYKLAHEIGERSVFKYDKLEEAKNYIAGQLSSYGYGVGFQDYVVENRKASNIIAAKKGTDLAEEVVLIGAHYDSCFNPGADDNASGIAGLLELARLFSNIQTGRTVKFVAFTNEEPPFYKTEDMGSRVYAKEAKARKEDIKAVIILEMIGYYIDKPNSQSYPPFLGIFYPNRGNFVAVVGNFPSRALVKKVVSSFKQKTQFPIEQAVLPSFIPGVDFSDHWSFWKEGYPAVMITDTAFYRYAHYHQSSDTYEKLNYAAMAEVVNGLKAVLVELLE
jgi:Zn-dependent M28 family amino/carboxypeptidase